MTVREFVGIIMVFLLVMAFMFPGQTQTLIATLNVNARIGNTGNWSNSGSQQIYYPSHSNGARPDPTDKYHDSSASQSGGSIFNFFPKTVQVDMTVH